MRNSDLNRRGYRDPRCSCRIETLGSFGAPQYPAEVAWDPKCPVHGSDVTGIDYVTDDGSAG